MGILPDKEMRRILLIREERVGWESITPLISIENTRKAED